MKILWVNPSFLDYRIPVYANLFQLTGQNFHLVYSQKRVPERIVGKIESAMGANAVGLLNETILDMPRTGDFANTDLKLPYQPGLYDAISKIDADIIIGEGFFQWTPMALLRARLKRKKFLLAYERTAHTERNCPRWRKLYRVVISRFVDGYLVNGQLTKEYLEELGVKPEKIFIGGMSADSDNLVLNLNATNEPEMTALRGELSIRTGLTYLYAGQITERKGVIHLLNAWEKHTSSFPEDKLIIIGTGPLHEQYKSDFSHIASILLMGQIDYDLIHRYYAITDVFIMPTLEDNWSLVVPEAMACGLPIACSIFNGCYPELVHEGVNGKLFNPLKEESILETLSYFHAVDLKQMGEQSKVIEKRYSAESVAQNIYEACRTFA